MYGDIVLTCVVEYLYVRSVRLKVEHININNLPENIRSGEELLTIDVFIKEFNAVKGHSGEACMILFDGYCHNELFNGDILHGGVDTQKQESGSNIRTLSARYILQGKDYEGKECRLFIENNGAAKGGTFTTTPKILTDSEALKFLEKADLIGSIRDTSEEGHILIHIKMK